MNSYCSNYKKWSYNWCYYNKKLF